MDHYGFTLEPEGNAPGFVPWNDCDLTTTTNPYSGGDGSGEDNQNGIKHFDTSSQRERYVINSSTNKESNSAIAQNNNMLNRGTAYTLAVCDDDSDMTSISSSPAANTMAAGEQQNNNNDQDDLDNRSYEDLEVDEEIESNEEEFNEDAFNRYHGKPLLYVVRFCCVLSVVSVCMNTPQTFHVYPILRYITLGFDVFATIILFIEMILKMRFRGIFYAGHSYLRSSGRLLELFFVLCLTLSIILQVYEITSDPYFSNYLVVSFVRAPRPLLLLRVIKAVFNLDLPSTVSYRSMRQIWGILMFLAYFLIIFALIGGQLFGVMKYFCVKNTTNVDANNITYNDLSIPIQRCPPTDFAESVNLNHCPRGFRCTKLEFKEYRQHAEYFDDIVEGIVTIYEAMSLEGWSFKMYESMDIISVKFIGFVYFFLVFLLIGLLVRNVFIAIITEAFADLRIQLSAFAKGNSRNVREDAKVLRKHDDDLKLVHVEEALVKSRFRRWLLACVTSKPFVISIHIAVFADAIIQSFLSDNKLYQTLQIVFTILFDIEALLKIVAMGFKHYLISETCLMEGIICLGSTALLPLVVMGMKQYAMFQVLRPFRLVLLYNSLRLFLRRILGSGKKITQLSLFTLSVVFIAAGIFLQMFCGFDPKNGDDFSFGTFPMAFKASFQILMQEAWVEVMDNLVIDTGRKLAVFPFIFIIFFHFFAATILVSVFVALILDNLELNEELKIVKQRRLGQELADTKEKLPARIRIFKLFKSQPKVINMDHVEYNVPKIRQTFVTNYLETAENMDDKNYLVSPKAFNRIRNEPTTATPPSVDDDDTRLNLIDYSSIKDTYSNKLRKQSSVTALMHQSNFKRQTLNSTASSNDDTSSTASTAASNRSIYRRGRSVYTHNSTGSSSTSTFVEQSFANLNRRVNRGIHTTADFGLNLRHANRKLKDVDTSAVRQKREEAQLKKNLQIEDLRENHPKFDESLFIFSANGIFRKYIRTIVHARYRAVDQSDKGVKLGAFSIDRFRRYIGTQTYLEWLMLSTTWISIIGIMWEFTEKYMLFNNDKNNVSIMILLTVEYIFFITSTIELLFKIIADGLIFAPEALIRDFGDVLHLFIYIVSLVFMCLQPTKIEPYSVAYFILVFRCLRPLRLITLCIPLRNEVWKVVRGYRDLLKVFIFLFVIMFIFASYGVQTFSNKLKRCNDRVFFQQQDSCEGFFEMTLAKPKLVKNLRVKKNETILVPRVWRNPRTFNFDTMESAFLALLEMLSLEGWTEVRDTIQEVSPPWGIIYPHLYVFFACLIVLTLFIGIIVSNFNESKGTALLTVEQKRWKDLKKKLELTEPLQLPPKPTENERKAHLYEILLGRTYNRLYSLVVLVNAATLFPGQWHPTEFTNVSLLALEIVAMVCCFVFLIDTLVKIYAFSVKGYFMGWGNRLDFFLMLGGLIFILWTIPTCHGVEMMTSPQHVAANDLNNHQCHNARRFGVAMFILRFLTLSFKHNALRMLMLTIVMGLFKSFWTIGVLIVFLLCYAFTGVIFFGSVKRGLYLNAKVNFESFFKSFILLIRIATGEDWNTLMHDAMISAPYCVSRPTENYWKSNCGSKIIAAVFFHSYIILITYILLNVFIAVVIENFSIFYSTDNDPIMSQQDIQIFQAAWNLVDDDYSGSVNTRKARFLLRLIYERLGLDKPLMLKRMCLEIDKNQTGKSNKVTFHNVLFVIAYKKIADLSKSLQLEERLAREELDNMILEEVAMETIRSWAVRVCIHHKKLRPRSDIGRRISGMTEGSIDSVDSIDEGNYDPLISSPYFNFRRSVASISLTPTFFSPASSFDKSNPNDVSSFLKKRMLDGRKEMKSEFYSWWDDTVEDGE